MDHLLETEYHLPPNEDIVADLERLLTQAKRGDLATFAIAGVYHFGRGDNVLYSSFYGAHPHRNDNAQVVSLLRENVDQLVKHSLPALEGRTS